MDLSTKFGKEIPSRNLREKRPVFANNAEMTIHILPTKTRGCAPRSPEADENNKNGGCPSDKTTVCQKHCFRHPEECLTLLDASENSKIQPCVLQSRGVKLS